MRLQVAAVVTMAGVLGGPARGGQDPQTMEPVARAEKLIAAGRLAEAETLYRDWFAANPGSVPACEMLAAFLFKRGGVAQGFEDGMPTLETCVELRGPGDADAHQDMARFYWHRAYGDAALSPGEKDRYADRALGHVNAALAVKPDLMDALVYKALLLRLKARLPITDEALRPEYRRQADELRARAADLRRRGAGELSRATLPEPPPPAIQLPRRIERRDGPRRVGGAIKEPRKVKTVPPVYPEDAKAARIEGVVVLECTIGADGTVADVQVLRGVPLLEEAAVEAVKQWEYTPTLVDEVAVPVVMTVTVNFRLR